jgi:hypothetical protein
MLMITSWLVITAHSHRIVEPNHDRLAVRRTRCATSQSWDLRPGRCPALVGHLHVWVVDLDTVDPPDQDQDLVHTGYTRRSQTSNGCQRSI